MLFESSTPRPQFRIVIEEREQALDAFYRGLHYELPAGASLSVRNLVSRAVDVEQLLRERVGGTALSGFVRWLLNDVVLVGIRAPSRDNGFRIFETMNDRGARLTSVDLLKSFLLSHVRRDEEKLNIRWRTMLGQLTTVREDHDAPAKFIKAALIAKHARCGNLAHDMEEINTSPSVWVQEQREAFGLAEEGDSYFQFVDELIQLATFYRTFLHATCRHFDELEAIFFNEANGLSSQMIGILAAVRPDDGLTIAKDKAKRIANFIDRWYVTRVIDDQPTLLPVQACTARRVRVRYRTSARSRTSSFGARATARMVSIEAGVVDRPADRDRESGRHQTGACRHLRHSDGKSRCGGLARFGLHLAVVNRAGWFVGAQDDAEVGHGELDRAHRCWEDAVVEQAATGAEQ